MLPLLPPSCFSTTLQPRLDIRTSEPQHLLVNPDRGQRMLAACLAATPRKFIDGTRADLQPCGQIFNGQNFRMEGLRLQRWCRCWCLCFLHTVLLQFHWCPAALRCGTTADLSARLPKCRRWLRFDNRMAPCDPLVFSGIAGRRVWNPACQSLVRSTRCSPT